MIVRLHPPMDKLVKVKTLGIDSLPKSQVSRMAAELVAILRGRSPGRQSTHGIIQVLGLRGTRSLVVTELIGVACILPLDQTLHQTRFDSAWWMTLAARETLEPTGLRPGRHRTTRPYRLPRPWRRLNPDPVARLDRSFGHEWVPGACGHAFLT